MKKFAIVGDSHAVYFTQLNKLTKLSKSYYDPNDYKVADISAATIRGFGNRDSTLKVSDQINKLIENTQPHTLIFCLGQVDIELGYYYRSIIKEKNVDNFIEETITIYKNYLLNLQQEKKVNIVIKGINPTVLINQIFAINYIGNITTENFKTPEERKFYKQKVADELPDYSFRFSLSSNFNNALKDLADRFNWSYFDIWNEVIDPKTGNIYLKYLPAWFDHHLVDSVEVRQIHYDALYKVMRHFIP
ncbi:hypothetical protein QV08_10750 [Gallibacterium salpingitidis]|uniref:hypothetical protein n=1 Tax=Gallibacterium salpingitidis TaxID=505341 RepID=UPI000805E21D|nr:hypothetical protein [Gallibacterium salpingitidis]OBX06237.1 hypothetical protein QV08_10750 [Gallibacterium salpingitidis]